MSERGLNHSELEHINSGLCVCACAISQFCSRRKEKHSRQQNKTNRTHKGKKCTYILRGRKKAIVGAREQRKPGQWGRGGQKPPAAGNRPDNNASGMCRPTREHSKKNAERHRAAESIIMIRAPLHFTPLSQPAYCDSEQSHLSARVQGPKSQ